ncbi:MAG: hypothetical protein ABR498_05320 [Candidatus Dormibacteria bacterium]
MMLVAHRAKPCRPHLDIHVATVLTSKFVCQCQGAGGRILSSMCRVCLKRPEISDERYGRCEQCAKAGRIALRFRLAADRTGGYTVKAGELSPRGLRQKWRDPMLRFNGRPSVRAHLGLHEVDVITARDRVETVRIASDLGGHEEAVITALRHAVERTDAAW